MGWRGLPHEEPRAYDELDRLTLWKLGTPTGSREAGYEYDVLGNLKKVFVDSQLTEESTYGQGGRPHALKTTLQSSYLHDATGRVVQGGGRSVAYTSFDLPKNILQAGKVTSFGYDAFQQRVRKSSEEGSVISLAGLYERRDKAGAIEHIFYVPGEGGPSAEVHFNEKNGDEKTVYLHSDALGSVRVTSDELGVDKERLYFEPFGRRIQHDGSPTGQNFSAEVQRGFTGHSHDDDLQLIDMRGRIDDPAIRRFLTPDPLVSLPLFGQSYNRYAYVLNNPLRFVDPTGFTGESAQGAGCAETALCPVSGRFDPNAGALKKATTRGAGQAKGPTKGPSKSSSDASGHAPETGAAASQPPGQRHPDHALRADSLSMQLQERER